MSDRSLWFTVSVVDGLFSLLYPCKIKDTLKNEARSERKFTFSVIVLTRHDILVLGLFHEQFDVTVHVASIDTPVLGKCDGSEYTNLQ
jgi:hypothetical protein